MAGLSWLKREDVKTEHRINFMSEEEIRMVDDFLVRLSANRAELEAECYSRWEMEQEAYSGDQPIEDNRPNSRVNVINANIEGQVAMVIEPNLAVRCRGQGPSDTGYAKWGEVGLEWTLRQNYIRRLIDRHERRRFLFGAGWLKIYWDADAVDGFGLAKIACPPLNSIFVDSKITDFMRIQEADYIAEVMLKSKSWAKQKYGSIADNINYGDGDKASIFTKETTTDDEDAFWLIQLWTKDEGILRMLEMSEDGILLYDSFKDKDVGRKPYYRYNRYPYFLTILYPEEGRLYGFGDGKLLRPLQDLINDLYDQIRRAARPNRIFFDPASEVDLDDLDEDDGPVPCNDPNQTIRVVEVGRVNPALWQLLSNIHVEVQRVTRFSELMTGQASTRRTATEASIQQQQGTSGTEHKKIILQDALVEMCKYILDMMMENYDGGKAFRLDEDKDDYEWVDFREMDNVPVVMPATATYQRKFGRKHPGQEMPKWMQVTDEKGKGMTKSVDLDIEITLGAGLPKNKAFLYQMLERLAPLVVEGKNVINRREFRKFIEEFIGLPLEEEPMPQAPQPTVVPPVGDVSFSLSSKDPNVVHQTLLGLVQKAQATAAGMTQPGGTPAGSGQALQSPDVEGMSVGGMPMQGRMAARQDLMGGGR